MQILAHFWSLVKPPFRQFSLDLPEIFTKHVVYFKLCEKTIFSLIRLMVWVLWEKKKSQGGQGVLHWIWKFCDLLNSVGLGWGATCAAQEIMVPLFTCSPMDEPRGGNRMDGTLAVSGHIWWANSALLVGCYSWPTYWPSTGHLVATVHLLGGWISTVPRLLRLWIVPSHGKHLPDMQRQPNQSQDQNTSKNRHLLPTDWVNDFQHQYRAASARYSVWYYKFPDKESENWHWYSHKLINCANVATNLQSHWILHTPN